MKKVKLQIHLPAEHAQRRREGTLASRVGSRVERAQRNIHNQP